MAMETRCDLSKMKLVGVDVGQGAVVVRDPSGVAIRIEVVGWPREWGEEPPNISWEAVRRVIANRHEDPPLVDVEEDEDVVPLRTRPW
jgi:hypothetical protein